MSNVIDFNSRKKKIGANAETPPTGFQEMMDAATLLFKDLPQHEMMFDAADALKRCRISSSCEPSLLYCG